MIINYNDVAIANNARKITENSDGILTNWNNMNEKMQSLESIGEGMKTNTNAISSNDERINQHEHEIQDLMSQINTNSDDI